MALELERQGDVYRFGELLLSPDPPEDVLLRLYLEWRKTDQRHKSSVLSWVWYGESVSLLFFLKWFTRPETSTLGCYRTPDNGATWIPAGLVWINRSEPIGHYKRAEVGMAFNRELPTDMLLIFGQLALEWGFRERCLDVIAGTTPAKNMAAVRFGKRLGFRVAGPVGGLVVWRGNLDDGYFQSLTADEWAAITPFREQQQEAVA